MHLAIDGYGSPAELLSNPEIVLEFLDKFPERIAMTKISEPSVQVYRGPVPQDWGVSGFVIIAESHISVHTFPDRNYLNVDVFSCKEFDLNNAKHQVQAMFQIEKLEAWVLDRGLEHLQPENASKVVESERYELQRKAKP
ncbi:MAG: S-adenosylmethionine decarboxylase proenzyme [Chloroflexi bacterium]|nr:S-adenosylmethionine decarboxylase proenzyme [Chloroflexota bacterium]MQF86689.1 S-adenosylmethionine decarboxylase proenzyme [SAR202 cluster bacterium]|tara:strand:+ start:1169 stop:1588 length:420 start_codon:yes stop_codon:yes gene_type:complete